MSVFRATDKQQLTGALIDEISGLKSQFDAFRFLKRLTEAYQSRAFIVFNLPPITSFDLQSNTVVTSWPPELLSAYDQDGLLMHSPLIRRLRNSTLPFFQGAGGDEHDHDDAPSNPIPQMLERLRMTSCAHFPTHDASGLRGCISFSGDRDEFSYREMADLSFLTIHIYDQLRQIRHLDSQLTETLTEREVDCLSWTASGKTSTEIAEIIGLSEYTVNQYLNRAARKLDTVNRTQAVAKALRIGIIK